VSPLPPQKNVVYFVGEDGPANFCLPLVNYAIDYVHGLISLVFDGKDYQDAKGYAARWQEPRKIGLSCHHHFGDGAPVGDVWRYFPMGQCLLNEFCEKEDGVTFLERRIGRTPFFSVHWQAPRRPSFEKYMRLFLMAGMMSEWDANPDFRHTGKAAALTRDALRKAYGLEGLSSAMNA
jgi:hypothetical protein